MEPLTLTLDGDNIFTAARRVVRDIRIDDEKDGGLLSQRTVQDTGILARHIEQLERLIKSATPGDRVKITITKEPADAMATDRNSPA